MGDMVTLDGKGESCFFEGRVIDLRCNSIEGARVTPRNYAKRRSTSGFSGDFFGSLLRLDARLLDVAIAVRIVRPDVETRQFGLSLPFPWPDLNSKLTLARARH